MKVYNKIQNETLKNSTFTRLKKKSSAISTKQPIFLSLIYKEAKELIHPIFYINPLPEEDALAELRVYREHRKIDLKAHVADTAQILGRVLI